MNKGKRIISGELIILGGIKCDKKYSFLNVLEIISKEIKSIQMK